MFPLSLFLGVGHCDWPIAIIVVAFQPRPLGSQTEIALPLASYWDDVMLPRASMSLMFRAAASASLLVVRPRPSMRLVFTSPVGDVNVRRACPVAK